MNIARLVQPGVNTVDPDWHKGPDANVIADDVEHWLWDVTMHCPRVSRLAAEVVRLPMD